jgi:hypothetical protein
MNTLLRFILIPAIAFGALDWAANNPLKVKMLRNEIVKQFDAGKNVAAQELDSMVK